MNAERLHAIVGALRQDLSTTKAINTLKELSVALQNQISSPQEPTYQTELAESLKKLTNALGAAPSNQFPPTWKETLAEVGVADLFGINRYQSEEGEVKKEDKKKQDKEK